jgi:ssDNA-specific exonuclease RecJ
LRQTPDVEHVPIVLIKANVCRLLEPMLMKDGFNVINNGGLVYFPACGHQQEFQEQLATILKRSKTEIRNKGSQYNKWS